ncbi:toprim domain-containing protein [Phormidesmis sp. 146-12]
MHRQETELTPDSSVEERPLPTEPSQQSPERTIAEQTGALFELESYSVVEADYQADVQGYDPTWDRNEQLTSPSLEEPIVQTPSVPQIAQEAQTAIAAEPLLTQVTRNRANEVEISALAHQVRNLDLAAVAASLGLEKDRRDKNKWKDAGHTISINDGKFMDWLTNKGGGGAIDLVMHIRQVDFKEAVQWLSGRSLTIPAQSQSVSKEPRLLELPQPAEGQWASVRQYLVETRGLPADWIDRFYSQGLIYADNHCNAVFLRYCDHKDDQAWCRHTPTGASLRGTRDRDHPFHGLAPGSSREDGWFWLRSGKGEVQRVVLTESPIDAISLAVLEKEKSTQDSKVSIYLSTDGSGAIPTVALKALLDRDGQVIAAFDADKAGEKMAWRIAEVLPGITRMSPAQGKDWNDRLMVEHHPERASVGNYERGDKDTLRSLWKWHRVAGELGRSDIYLKRITEVARAFVEGEPLSEKASVAMQQDFQTHKREKQAQSSPQQSNPSRLVEPPHSVPPKKSHQEVEMG